MNHESCPPVKFADDTELVGKISNDEDALYHKQTENFVNWCDTKLLVSECFQNEGDTCALMFRKNQRCPKGEAVERVVVFDSKLNWKENINSGLRKKKSDRECIA